MPEGERRENSTAFRVWYHESHGNIPAQHERALASTCGDRAMEKSLPRREMVHFLTSMGIKRPYGQDRFDSDDEDFS